MIEIQKTLKVIFHENGNKKSEGEWDVNKRHGPYREWYKNGQLRLESEWGNGKQIGRFLVWDQAGKLILDIKPGEICQETPPDIIPMKYSHDQSLTASPGRFRIAVVDKFHDSEHGIIGECETLERALAVARQMSWQAWPAPGRGNALTTDTEGDVATVYYVYDDSGKYMGGDIYSDE